MASLPATENKAFREEFDTVGACLDFPDIVTQRKYIRNTLMFS
jgi:hypothetical protein